METCNRAQCVCREREATVEQLTSLSHLVANPFLSDSIKTSIENLMDTLIYKMEQELDIDRYEDFSLNYPENISHTPPLIDDLVELDMKNVSKTEIDAAIDVASQKKVNTYTWEQVISRSIITPGEKYARIDWDNGFNQEYIMLLDNVGWVKYFRTVKVDKFKNVVHSFEPREEDADADWVILND